MFVCIPGRSSCADDHRQSLVRAGLLWADVMKCAIYTRKSSEEGLEQDFNSLAAQREAGEAYVASQRSQGWRTVKTRYDDGGFSGGNLDRPGLQSLLADVTQGKIQVVVVYKIDRLTRSLADFAKLVEQFDTHDVSLVAVTQPFNTTTSMGRLTLNVLLSFAQFEREITGERIRDKIAASKQKGLWMGGIVPLGYDVQSRALVIDPTEADTVRHIYRRYLDLGSVRRLKEALHAEGIVSKRRGGRDGRVTGGQPFSRGALYTLLKNRLYDGDGQPMSPAHTKRHNQHYRYYVSQRVLHGGRSETLARVAAHEAEQAVVDGLLQFLSSPGALLDRLAPRTPSSVARLQEALSVMSAEFKASDTQPGTVRALLKRADLADDTLRLTINLAPIAESVALSGAPVHTIELPVRIARCQHGKRLILQNAPRPAEPDATLVNALLQAHAWDAKLRNSDVRSFRQLGESLSVECNYVRRIHTLVFLAPDIQLAILEGRQPPDLTLDRLTKHTKMPLEFEAQRRLYGSPPIYGRVA